MFIVFDLDGTLADITHRTHFVRGGRRPDWDSFFAACTHDVGVPHVLASFDAHVGAGHKVRIWSGRSDVVRAETEAWLSDIGIDPFYLEHMRPAGDNTPDVELKRRWLHALHPDERPDVVYDDRQRVVDMWRDEGIACFQVTGNWEAPQVIAPIKDPLLTIMVGPSGGGKSTWAQANFRPAEIISSDDLREQYTDDFRDQSRNEDVFAAVHRLAKARLECGLPTVIDATNLRRRDRLACVALAPSGVGVRYVVKNLPMAIKQASAGWRADVRVKGVPLIEAHEQRFQSQLKDILRGDGLPQVAVFDARTSIMGEAA